MFSGKLSDILSDIFSDILSGILYDTLKNEKNSLDKQKNTKNTFLSLKQHKGDKSKSFWAAKLVSTGQVMLDGQ